MGIGGAHMSAIAQILHTWGHTVSGCDLHLSPVTERLAGLGVDVYEGHSPKHVSNVDMVVNTAAVNADNAELRAAADRKLPVLVRAEMVARLMEGRRSVCVAGTHGKSTTTSLIAFMLLQAGLDPIFLVGGEMNNLKANAGVGNGPHIVVEADEYAAAFLYYRPQIAVVTNIEPDHLDYYGSFENLVGAFRQFVSQVSPDGWAIIGADSPTARDLAKEGPGPRILRYALDAEAEWQVERVTISGQSIQTFVVTLQSEEFGSFQTSLPGRHNISNCLAAIAVGHELGLSVEAMREAIAEFRGVGRRFQLIGDAAGVTVMDDYAHHPTEVRATLATAKDQFPARHLVCLFQPHTYSRSQYLLDEFRTCFEGVDVLLIADTYAAREGPSAGVDARGLAEAIKTPPARYVGDLEEAAQTVLDLLQPGDVFFTIGAGDVDSVGPSVLEGLRKR
jgi:UDP-N-acetylmuramate--alanine ligase